MDCKINECRTWAETTAAFDRFRLPKLGFDQDGDVAETAWIFRGHKTANYGLEPSVEREARGKRISWMGLESHMLNEFQTKARLHMNPNHLPPMEDKLGWLALMQHHGVPTRLLDFTYSPYVALYFSLRGCLDPERKGVSEVWAINRVILDRVAADVSLSADREAGWKPSGNLVSNEYSTFATGNDRLKEERAHWDTVLKNGQILT